MAGLKHRRKAKTELDMQNQYLNAAFSEFIRAKEGDNLAKETIDAYKTSYKKFVDCFENIIIITTGNTIVKNIKAPHRTRVRQL